MSALNMQSCAATKCGRHWWPDVFCLYRVSCMNWIRWVAVNSYTYLNCREILGHIYIRGQLLFLFEPDFKELLSSTLWSATTLKLLTVEVHNLDHLSTMVDGNQWKLNTFMFTCCLKKFGVINIWHRVISQFPLCSSHFFPDLKIVQFVLTSRNNCGTCASYDSK